MRFRTERNSRKGSFVSKRSFDAAVVKILDFFVYRSFFYATVGTIAFFNDHFFKCAAWEIISTYFLAFLFLKRYFRPRTIYVSCSKDEKGAFLSGYETHISLDPPPPVKKPDFIEKLGDFIIKLEFITFGIIAVIGLFYLSITNIEDMIHFFAGIQACWLFFYFLYVFLKACTGHPSPYETGYWHDWHDDSD